MSIEIRAQVRDTLRAQSLEQLQHPARIELPQRYRHVLEEVAITLLAGLQFGEGLLARGNINDAGEPLGLVFRRVPHCEMRVEDRTIAPTHPRLGREVLIALNGGEDRLDIVLKAFIRPERHNVPEELLLAALPEQRDGVVIDVHDTGGLHERTDKSRVLSEVAPEIDDTGIANSAQHLSAARVVDLPERHRHGLEKILIASLAVVAMPARSACAR